MKRIIFFILLIACGFQGFSQTPGISYQAVILDPSVQELPGANAQNNILANSNIAVQFTIIDELNNQEYQEYHETSTDAYGMINLIIGHGNTISSNNFEDIVWEGLSKKLRIEIDFSGSRNSFVLLSDQELTFMPQPVVGGDAQVIIDNTDAIVAERNRAIQAEANIQSDVDANEAANDAADTTLQNNINTVQADVDQNEADADTAIQANTDALAAEVTRATNAEGANASAIATEKSRAEAAEALIQADVDANEVATDTAIANVQSDVDANEASNDAANVILQNNINTVQANVDQNEADADTAILANTDALAAEVTRATNAEGANASAIATEKNRAETVEAGLQTAVDSKVDKVTGKGLSTEDFSTSEKTKLAAITGTNTGDQDLSSYATNANVALKADIASPNFTGTVSGIDKTMVGLSNVDNTSDANKPVSTLQQTALDSKVDKVTGKGLSTEDFSTSEKTKLAAITGTNTGDQDLSSYATNANLALKADIASPNFTGTVSGIDKTMVGLSNVDNTSDANKPVSTLQQTALDSKVDKVTGKGLSTEDFSTSEKTKLAAITGTNTGDQDLSSYATNANVALKADIASPNFTGTVSGIDKTMVGLSNVDNTSDANKPVSTLQQTTLDSKVDKVTGKGLSTEDFSTSEKTKLAAITGTNTGDQDLSSYATNANVALKADIASPTLTGTPAAPTATAGTNTTQIATTAFVRSAVSTATSGNFVDLTTNQQIAGKKTFWRHIKLYTNNMPETMNIGFPPNGENQTAIAMGIDALFTHRYGERTIGIGHESLYKDIRGSDNIGIGYRTLYNIEHTPANDWGNRNVAIGSQSGSNVIVGDNNTLIGTYSDTFTDGISNGTALGYQAVVTADNTIQLGNASVTDVITSGKLTTGAITLPNTDGTANQVLQTNGSGVLTWTTPTTTATAYSGVLPLANGGTGSATKNFVDLTTNQTIAGTKTFSSNIITNGVTVGAGANGVNSNTAIGIDALVLNTTGIANVAIGDEAGLSITGSYNVAIGFATNRNAAEGDNNIAIGNSANYQGTSGAGNISLGAYAYRQGDSGSYNIVLGRSALYDESAGSHNIALGYNASRNSNGGEGNITLGYLAGNTITTGDYNLVVGYDADVASGTLTNATALGNGAIVSASNTIQLGNTSVTDVITSGKLTTGAITLPNTDGTVNQVLQTNGSGTLSWTTPSSGATNVTGLSDALVETSSIFIGNDPSSTTNNAQYNVAVGTTALDAITTGKTNVAVGYDALTANTSGEHNTAIGWSALKSNTVAHYNTAYGYSALNNNTDGTHNTANGPFTLHYNTTGSNNTAYGTSAIYGNQTGSNNTANGASALGFNTNGNYNTAMGAEAGRYLANGSAQNQSGNYNVYLGAATKASVSNTQNEIVIGYNATGGGSNTVQLGNTSITNVNTSGTITAGAITIPNTDGTVNQVLQTNGSGVLSWSTPSVAAPVREVADEFSATASQTSFTLTQIPSTDSKVKMYINGIRISNTAYSVSGTTLTYVPANNGTYALSASDRIQFDFYY